MKRKIANILWIIVVALALCALIGFYLYEVVVLKVPFTDHLFRLLAVTFVLAGTLTRLIAGRGRKPLQVYEQAYKNELEAAFLNKPFLRNKLLCACRLYDESNYGKALKYLFQLLKEAETERDAVPILLFIALCYTDAGVPDQAIRAYYELLQHDPRHAQAHNNLGHLYLRAGNWEMALQHCNKSIELNPYDYYAYANRANYYFRRQEYANAIADAEKALSIKNNGQEAASLLTVIYALTGDTANKQKYYHIAITSGKSPEDMDEAIRYFLHEVAQEEETNSPVE